MNELEPTTPTHSSTGPISPAEKMPSASNPALRAGVNPEASSEVKPGLEMPLASPSVFDFRDYRQFLTQWFRHRKLVQPGYSGALFAKKAGIQAHSLFSMVARGERNLSYETQRGFARALGLKGREAAYFEKLVLFNQASTTEDKKMYFEELIAAAQAGSGAGATATGGSNASSAQHAAAGRAHALLTQLKDHAEYLSHWYIVAIREMIELKNFKDDPEWIASKLKRRVTTKQVRQALDLLLKLELIARDPAQGGRLVIRQGSVDVPLDGINFAARSYHKEYLDLFKDAIDHDPIENRDMSSVTLSVSLEELKQIQKRVQDFGRQLNSEFSGKAANATTATEKTHTITINVQSLLIADTSDEPTKKQS